MSICDLYTCLNGLEMLDALGIHEAVRAAQWSLGRVPLSVHGHQNACWKSGHLQKGMRGTKFMLHFHFFQSDDLLFLQYPCRTAGLCSHSANGQGSPSLLDGEARSLVTTSTGYDQSKMFHDKLEIWKETTCDVCLYRAYYRSRAVLFILVLTDLYVQ